MGGMPHTSEQSSPSSVLDLDAYPYLARVEKLQKSYPALKSLLSKLRNHEDEGRRLVTNRHARRGHGEGRPGRCAVLTFEEDQVHDKMFHDHEELALYFKDQPPGLSASNNKRRLFILEDMDVGFVDLLGQQLGVDPLIYSEQVNSWNYTDSQSVPHRALPSLNSPEKSWTLRYNEIRTLDANEPARVFKSQMTHAVNRRKWERWQDVDLPSVQPDKRHALIRRGASFWTDHDGESGGWNALILVDPPMDSCSYCSEHIAEQSPAPNNTCTPGCLLLEDRQKYLDRKGLWQSKNWDQKGQVIEVRHRSVPYHGGCPTLISPLELDRLGDLQRNMASPLDEIVFYWTKCKNDELLKSTLRSPVNSAYYLLKFLAYAWSAQLEFIACSVANSEFFADDHEAKVDARYTTTDWKDELMATADATKDVQFMRRKMGHFESAMTLSLERLGIPVDSSPAVDGNTYAQSRRPLPLALVEAQRDFLSMSQRMQPFRQRIDDLSSIATDVAGLQVAFKSIRDSEQGLWLSVFAAIIFPLTLVASIFSMSEDYLPGAGDHWMFWATSVPLAIVISAALTYKRGSEQHARQAWHRLSKGRLRRKTEDPEIACR